MSRRIAACCSSPAAIGYWFAVSLVAWVLLSIAGMRWYLLRWYGAPSVLLAAAIGCAANWIRNRSFHCAITGPLFLVAGLLFLLAELNLISIRAQLLWGVVSVGTGIAFLLEWRYAKGPAQAH